MYKPQDHVQQIADYIKKNLNKGYTIDSLKVSLLNQGYSRISIEKAIELTHEQLAAKAPPMKEKPVIEYRAIPTEMPKESFFKRIFKGFFK